MFMVMSKRGPAVCHTQYVPVDSAEICTKLGSLPLCERPGSLFDVVLPWPLCLFGE